MAPPSVQCAHAWLSHGNRSYTPTSSPTLACTCTTKDHGDVMDGSIPTSLTNTRIHFSCVTIPLLAMRQSDPLFYLSSTLCSLVVSSTVKQWLALV